MGSWSAHFIMPGLMNQPGQPGNIYRRARATASLVGELVSQRAQELRRIFTALQHLDQS